MNKIKYTTVILLSCLILGIQSCKKTAGEGGTSSIKGSIIVEDWNKSFTIKNGEYPGMDEDVYIIYGDDVNYGDRTRANNNGEFEFKYLRKGKYKIYVYSEDNKLQAVSGTISVEKEIEITNNKTQYNIEQFRIYK
ncbi:MAG: hypothetical protein IPM51_09180 [Sphingobacteriaceae bacterium]|nr:hypothetical protein [Sphingobacteriaceae bacterium]